MGYLLDNDRLPAGDRVVAMASLFDPITTGHLDGLGIGPGWRCWEVGAGGTSIVHWLAGRTGRAGYVLATDTDTTVVAAAAGPTVIVLRHDVCADPIPGGGFDLVHARMVLADIADVADRAQALAAMVRALRPGGWLVVEDLDPRLQPLACPDERGPAEVLANKVRAGVHSLLASRGIELACGRTIPGALRDLGLADVTASGYFPMTGPECAALERTTVTALYGDLLNAGLATPDELDAHLGQLDALHLSAAPMISAWGRKPAA
ncbi:class I SAM-dependent methyltransferase [Labedaea rhizosphaerae]|uniref:Methyltransferase family protein n=1 Tax=Labedaea rhizosphaerae TaxID=598644 RepID=A0A4R6SA44_LABRH|nr:methyltransferase domain-containing protein [Labedaea rhizosphaerae]TDP96364.1 methyltransferase family protein [Labedaea rhizosphaerae]